jgi:hypothetical protein
MNRVTGSLVAAVLTIAVPPVPAQWLNVPTKGIPRTKDGKPDLAAPAPRKPDGKPDVSGIWKGDPQNQKYLSNLAVDFKPGESPIQPWAEALTKKRIPGGSEWPPANCLPPGVPVHDNSPAFQRPVKIVQEPDLVIILYEVFGQFRQIFLDGRYTARRPESHLVGVLSRPVGWGHAGR